MSAESSTVTNATQPFIKWAGGKRQLLGEIEARLPKKWGTYYEPFVGGGAVLFRFNPEKAVINDINKQLINAYIAIRDDPDELMRQIDVHDDLIKDANEPKEYFYTARSRFNELLASDKADTESAALFVFLNKHCFNGLYRVNAKGLYNVPCNGSRATSYARENILAISDYLKRITILNGDFEDACKNATTGDFVFIDSPYAPLNPTSFESYTKEGFAEEEHRRLAALYQELTERGCFCMLTNHDTKLINDLYDGFNIDVVQVKRAINSDASKRTGTEVIIRNY